MMYVFRAFNCMRSLRRVIENLLDGDERSLRIYQRTMQTMKIERFIILCTFTYMFWRFRICTDT